MEGRKTDRYTNDDYKEKKPATFSIFVKHKNHVRCKEDRKNSQEGQYDFGVNKEAARI